MHSAHQKSIQYLKGVGEKKAALFARLGVKTVGDLLALYPRQYEDWSQIFPIAAAPLGERCCVRATALAKPVEHRIRKGMTLYKFTVSDGVSGMHVTLFNNKYAAATIHAGEEYVFFGTVEQKFHRYEMSSPTIAPAVGGDRIRPIYPQTAGLPSAAIERAVKAAFEAVGESVAPEILPPDVVSRHGLVSRSEAIRSIHFPASQQALAAARDRLVFEELFVLQLGLLRLKRHIRSQTAVTVRDDHTAAFCASLPFTLTGAQKRALTDCVRDMSD
ncbi:MAG: ATP-dependent DNA helicase RecG, partial [Clostridia bacterium]|nr:ATP-dependent DNA helicase RecG [Clostridia bacterium]